MEKILDTPEISLSAADNRTEKEAYNLYIQEKLAEAQEYAKNPNAKRYTWEEVREIMTKRHGI
jgi:hypothetical protein